MLRKLTRALLYPKPLRMWLLPPLLRRLPIYDYKTRLDFDLVPRPHYGYCMYYAALQAHALGLEAMSVIEFGVGGGRGLLAAEHHKEQIERCLGLRIELFGFDLGDGLPTPVDYRDMPQFWQQGFYKMDVDSLRKRLKYSELILGNVSETIRIFWTKNKPAAIGAIFFDLDYYSSTKAAFSIFDAPSSTRLPRIFCYFDDIIGLEYESFHKFGGELLAIHEFNEENNNIKISLNYGLTHKRKIPAPWNEQIFVVHDFDHPLYTKYVHPTFEKRGEL